MNKIIISLSLMVSSMFAYTDEKPYTTYTGEILQCNLIEGKDVNDVLKMVKKDWYALSYPAPYLILCRC